MTRLLLPLGFALYAVAAFVLMKRAPYDLRADAAQPLIVATYWQQFGGAMSGALLASVALATFGYVAALRSENGNQYLWLICASSCACALAAPVIFSSDVYAYAAYGDMAARGINPYAHVQLAARSPLLDAAQWQWGNPLPACVYGPLFILLARLCVVTQVLGASAPLWTLRIVACASLTLVARFAPARVASVVTLNPAAIWACAEGHNDIFAIAIAMLGLAISRQRAFTGSFLAVFSAALKLPGLAAAFFVDRHNRSARRGVLAALALCVMLYLPLLPAAFSRHGGAAFAPHFSPLFLFATAMPMPFAIAVTIAFCLAVWLRGRDGAHATLALWLLIPNPYPWYGVWLLPVAAAAQDRYARAALIAASLLCMLRYYGEATSALATPLESFIVVCAYGIPLLLMGRARDRFVRRGVRTSDPDLAHARPR